MRLAPQPFRVLALLVRRAGELVTREEIQAAVWADGTTVEFDQGLNYCIRQIRLALNEDAKEPQYIDTVPKRGYRFVAKLVPVEVALNEAASPTEEPVRATRRWAIGATLALGALGAAWLFRRPARRLPKSAEAVKKYRVAEVLSNTWEAAKIEDAAKLYREIIGAEPDFADAYASLANALIMLAQVGETRQEALEEAEKLALKAASMDDGLALAHAALGHCYWLQWQFARAGAEFMKAVDADPDSPEANQLYSLYLASTRRAGEALQRGRRAAEIQPTSGLMQHSLAVVYLHTGHYGDAVQQELHTLKIYRHWPTAYQVLVRASVASQNVKEAGGYVDEWERFAPGAQGFPLWRAYWLARTGHILEARSAFDAWAARPNNGGGLAAPAVLVALGDHAGALARIEVLATKRATQWIRTAPELQPLHSDPHFQELLTRVGWP